MSLASPESLAGMAAQGLRLEPPPTEAEIDDVLARLANAFSASQEAVGAARKLLHARFSIRMEMGQTIKVEHTPWLAPRRAAITPFYWTRYHELLLRSGWSPLVAATLDRAMDDLLDMLGDPSTTQAWTRRGLVVGDVQSGKTASYAALICKAADAGYRMVILLAGTLENVRRQTQERLDAAFVGLDSRDFLLRGQLMHKTHIGVGHINSQRDGVVFTSRDSDFRKSTATALNISLDSVREPVLVVTKKNKRILDSLAGWLRTRNADREGHIDLPLLLIDDEADNASINTRSNPGETTAINRAIRDLLSLFRRSSYVGFTATPFANIFIDPTSTNDMLGDDLFPRHFIHLLSPPDNYVGMDTLFPAEDPDKYDPYESQSRLSGLRRIEDDNLWLPPGHKKEISVGPLPASLCTAIRYFLLSCAARDVSAQRGEGARAIHRSMLINVSRFTAVQDVVAGLVHNELERIRQQVRLYGKLPSARGAAESADIAALKATFESEMAGSDTDWPTVLSTLHEAISPIKVQPVNQRTGAASLDYSVVDAPPGVRVIAVGGDSLSRGLTLEGLCVSYFLRNSKAYDTLLQMSRWFGYREGYRHLCRVWLSADAESWYRHVAEATNELKRDFVRMRRQRATPAEFGLRVRTHPDTLLITARNKMASGLDVVGEVRDISLAGRGIETARLYADELRNRENFTTVDSFLAKLAINLGAPVNPPDGRAALWHNVPAALVALLLRDFLVHPLNHDFQGEAIADFLESAVERGDLQYATWSVAVPTKGDGDSINPALRSGIVVKAKERVVLVRQAPPQSLLVSGTKARVGSRGDVRLGLSDEEVNDAFEAHRRAGGEVKDVPEDAFRATMRKPLLVIYLIQGFERAVNGTDRSSYRNGLVLPALGLHFPGVKDLDAPKRYIRYRLNLVAQGELELEGDDLPNDDEED